MVTCFAAVLVACLATLLVTCLATVFVACVAAVFPIVVTTGDGRPRTTARLAAPLDPLARALLPRSNPRTRPITTLLLSPSASPSGAEGNAGPPPPLGATSMPNGAFTDGLGSLTSGVARRPGILDQQSPSESLSVALRENTRSACTKWRSLFFRAQKPNTRRDQSTTAPGWSMGHSCKRTMRVHCSTAMPSLWEISLTISDPGSKIDPVCRV